MNGGEGLSPELGSALLKALDRLPPGERFDEATYDDTLRLLVRSLRDAGHASAEVKGQVEVDPTSKLVTIQFKLSAGPLMELGDVCVEGFGKLPPRLILQASDLRPGHPFSETEIEDARTRIYQMRVLSEVEITAGRVDPRTGANTFVDDHPEREGEWLAWQDGQAVQNRSEEADASAERVCRLAKKSTTGQPRVPIEIRVKPAQLYRLGVGAGLQIGVEDGQRSINATSQWDVHLFAYTEVRNFLGGLRRLRVEERPKLIFLAPFPTAKDEYGEREVRPGNNLSLLLEWPAFIEPRTLLRLTGTWDLGPDPYGAKFIRDDINVGLGPSRGFLRNRLNAAFAIQYNAYIPRTPYGPKGEQASPEQLADEKYHLFFLRQVLEWDTRNDHNSPTRGLYGRVEVHETLPPSAWGYVRFTPELRGYVPLPYGLVIAVRAGLGWIAIRRTDADKPEELRRLGPRPYRLRGGGPYSVRGVQAGTLGRTDQDVQNMQSFPGGTKSWISSVELRVPLGDSFGIATFMDVGDVDGGSEDRPAKFRLNYPNTTLGAGLRYKTLVGPLRLDVGMLVPGLQGKQEGQRGVDRSDPLFKLNGAVLLTIGEAF